MSRVLIILVNFRRASDTVECICSLLNQRYDSWSAVVYDNGSGDNSYLNIIRRLDGLLPAGYRSENIRVDNINSTAYTKEGCGDKGKVVICGGASNSGFAGGNNAALSIANKMGLNEVDYIWFLNNDTVVDPKALTYLIRRMQEPDAANIGICGATICYFGSDDIVQCYGGASYSKWTGFVSEIGKGDKLTTLPSREAIEAKLDYVSGASMFASKSFVDDVGPMNEEYFLYFEELDWSFRGRQHGFRLGYAPEAKIWHREGAVLGSGASTTRSALAEFYGLRSKLRFTIRYIPEALINVWLLGVAQLLKRLIGRNWVNAKSLILALCLKDSP